MARRTDHAFTYYVVRMYVSLSDGASLAVVFPVIDYWQLLRVGHLHNIIISRSPFLALRCRTGHCSLAMVAVQAA